MEIESQVKSYCRRFPEVFVSAHGSTMVSAQGLDYIDFLSGCGALNYGHNHETLKSSLLNYIQSNGVVMSLDMMTTTKERFLKSFVAHILSKRSLHYRIQFTGPTGANAVEAAIKLARKVTKRTNIIAFTNGFHGCSLGALALTGNAHHRLSSTSLLNNVSRFPYDGYLGEGINTADLLEKMLLDPSSGCDAPAAIIFETIQGEGGLNAASAHWAQQLQCIARDHGALLIVDDIQAGCGRSGKFFSFESLGIDPDIVCLAKSISGFGLPMSLVLLKTEHDQWAPGEHNGTFRGNNYAFVTAAAAIELFWQDDAFQTAVQKKATRIYRALSDIARHHGLAIKGRGLMLGIDLGDGNLAAHVQAECFRNRLIVECCGPRDNVLKLLPPLTVEEKVCQRALSIIEESVANQFSAIRPVRKTARAV